MVIFHNSYVSLPEGIYFTAEITLALGRQAQSPGASLCLLAACEAPHGAPRMPGGS